MYLLSESLIPNWHEETGMCWLRLTSCVSVNFNPYPDNYNDFNENYTISKIYILVVEEQYITIWEI